MPDIVRVPSGRTRRLQSGKRSAAAHSSSAISLSTPNGDHASPTSASSFMWVNLIVVVLRLNPDPDEQLVTQGRSYQHDASHRRTYHFSYQPALLLTTNLIMAPNETRISSTWDLQQLHGEQTGPLTCLHVEVAVVGGKRPASLFNSPRCAHAWRFA